jgi:hypothetical protein
VAILYGISGRTKQNMVGNLHLWGVMVDAIAPVADFAERE